MNAVSLGVEAPCSVKEKQNCCHMRERSINHDKVMCIGSTNSRSTFDAFNCVCSTTILSPHQLSILFQLVFNFSNFYFNQLNIFSTIISTITGYFDRPFEFYPRPCEYIITQLLWSCKLGQNVEGKYLFWSLKNNNK